MRLVTFEHADTGVAVGHVDGEEIAVLSAPTMREYFERGGADETGVRVPFGESRLQRADHAEEVPPHCGQLPRARGGVEAGQLDARDRAVDRLLPERRRDRRAGRAGDLSRAPDRGARLRARAGRHREEAGQWFSPEEAADYIGGYVIFNDITARDIQRREMRSGVFSICKAIDTFCPLGPWIVTPDEIADPHDLAMELRVNGAAAPGVALLAHVGHDPRDPEPLLDAHLLGGRHRHDRHRLGRRRLLARRRLALPEARRRHGVRDRGRRRAPQPGHLLAGGARRARAAARRW